MKKSITLGASTDDQPDFTIVKGHCTTTEFNKAMRKEGWIKDWVFKSELSKEWWIHTDKMWVKSTKENPIAEPVTVLSW
jgi:hypothetical protein